MKKFNLLFISLFLFASFKSFGQSSCTVNATAYNWGSSTVFGIPNTSCADSHNIIINGFANLNGGGCNSGNGFSENFNNTTLNSNWSYIYPDTIISNNTCSVPSIDGTDFAWMAENTGTSQRSMETDGLDLTGLSNVTVCFEMRYAIQGQTSPCEGPDLPSEGVYLQYSIDAGASWIQLAYYSPTSGGTQGTLSTPYTSWGQYHEQLPIAAMTSSTKFRWIQGVNSSPLFDNWGLDNIFIGDSGANDYTITYNLNNTGYQNPPVSMCCSQGNYNGLLGNISAPSNNTYTDMYVIQMSNGTNSCYDTVYINQDNNFQILIDSIVQSTSCTANDGEIYLSNPDSTFNGGSWLGYPIDMTWTLSQGGSTINIDTTSNPNVFSASNLSTGTYTILNTGYLFSNCIDTITINIGGTGCSITADYTPSNYSCFDSITLSAVGTECNSGNTTGCYNGSYFNDDFNNGQAMGWNFSQVVTITANTCGVASPDGSNFLWMGGSSPAPRIMETVDLDVSNGGGICFEMRYAIQSQASPCEGPDLPNEGVSLEYSIDGGLTWGTINYWAPTNMGNPGGTPIDMTVWNQFSEQLPVAAQTNSTRFRWHQAAASNATFDHWGLDKIQIGDTLTNPSNYTISWQHDNYSLTPGVYSGSNPTPIVAPNSNSGANSYVVQMTDGTNTCYDTVVINTPGALINLDTVVNFICGNDGYVTVSDIGGASTNPLNFVLSNTSVILDTNITNGVSCTFNGLTSGVYDIVLTDTNSCADTVTFTIMQDSLLSATLSMQPDLGMASGSATAVATGGYPGYTYLWNDALSQTTSTASGLVSDWYTVVVTDSNGCTYTDSIFVTRSIGLNENSNQNVYIYPNPTNNLIYVSGLNDFSFEIVDLKGRVLNTGKNANIISIEDFANGIYVLNLENNGFIKKFFVVKE
tara:strand:+ start:2758 stop:5517 length:2760 start_codon:yes stop_codon:yes gene_type:complete